MNRWSCREQCTIKPWNISASLCPWPFKCYILGYVIQGVLCNRLTENMEYTNDFTGYVLLFVLPCLSQVLLSAAVYDFKLYFLCQMDFLGHYKNAAKLLLLVNKVSNGFLGRVVHLSFALQLYFYGRDRVFKLHFCELRTKKIAHGWFLVPHCHFLQDCIITEWSFSISLFPFELSNEY